MLPLTFQKIPRIKKTSFHYHKKKARCIDCGKIFEASNLLQLRCNKCRGEKE